MSPKRYAFHVILSALLLAPSLSGSLALAGEGSGIKCTVSGGTVSIAWEELLVDIAVDHIRVSRDNEIVGEVGPDALEFVDEDVPDGRHVYSVDAITPAPPGDPVGVFHIGRCEVFVDGERFVSCTVDAPFVTIEWEIPPNAFALGFVITRNERTIVELDADARSYRDEVPGGGVYIYTVSTDNTVGGQRPPDFLIGSCRVEIEGPPALPPPEDLSCSILKSFPVQVQLSWFNPIDYDTIFVARDGTEIARLPGNATRFREVDPGPGVHVYEVSGAIGRQRTDPASCEVETDGGGRDHLLLVPFGAAAADEAPNAGVTAVLRNIDPIQGWSFGVCSDPRVIVPASTTIDGTTTATLNDGEGPEFNATKIHDDGGVTMAVVIDQLDPADTLGVGEHTLIHVRYEPGPEAELGTEYGVRYCDELSEPPVAVVVVVEGFSRPPATSSGVVFFSPDRYLRGDTNNDGRANMSDGVFLLDWLFRGGRKPTCMEASDINGSRAVDIADGIYLFQALFSGGPPPPAPYPDCGPGGVELGCETSSCEDV